jgi:hypothetical protein
MSDGGSSPDPPSCSHSGLPAFALDGSIEGCGGFRIPAIKHVLAWRKREPGGENLEQ